jgi:hypothetical protein
MRHKIQTTVPFRKKLTGGFRADKIGPPARDMAVHRVWRTLEHTVERQILSRIRHKIWGVRIGW